MHSINSYIRDMTLILGDFNARVGSRISQWRSVIGPYGSDEVNDYFTSVPITT